MSYILKVVYGMSPQYIFLSNMYHVEHRFEITSWRYQVHAGAPYPQTLQYSQVYFKKVHAIVLVLAKRTHFGKHKLSGKKKPR
jgi:hypothetical protein